jgi:glyoxylase-like metal-dependent hydrolase (beta-lactamase superfamily II)
MRRGAAMHCRLLLATGCLLAVGVAGWLGRAGPREQAAGGPWREVHSDGPLAVYRADGTPAAYLLRVRDRALLIDAPGGPDRLRPPAGVSVEAVLLTHHHRDTVAGVGGWLKAGIPVRAGKRSAEWLAREGVARFWKESIPLRTSQTAYFVVPEGYDGIEFTLNEGEAIDLDGYRVTVLHTPGHSRDHLAFAVSRAGAAPLVFCGDAVTGDGKLWTPFTTDWDHWTDAGLKPAGDSLRVLARLKPAALFPARGPVVKENPAALLEKAAAAVEEVAFLKSFERFTHRLGNPPKYDFLVPREQVGSAGDKPWARVSDHLWLTGNTYVLVSKQNNSCLVLDPWGQRSVDQVEKLRKDQQLGPVEVVVFSHAHYDHYDGVYSLPGRDSYKVWALDIVAGPLMEPFRYRAPFLDARPIEFDRILKDGEAATWREYSLKFHALPGQTAFTSGIEATIDGKRCLFTADNFFHQEQYSGSGGWMGLNRSFPAVYAQSAQKVLKLAPEWVLAEHGGPYVFHTEDFRRRVRWGEAAGKAADAVCVSGNHLRDWNPHRISVEPALVMAKPGGLVRATIRVGNENPDSVRIRFEGRGIVRDENWNISRLAAENEAASMQFRLPETLVPGRYVFSVHADMPESGDYADAFLAVDVTSR